MKEITVRVTKIFEKATVLPRYPSICKLHIVKVSGKFSNFGSFWEIL